MQRIPLPAGFFRHFSFHFWLLTLVGALLVLTFSYPELPERVATHFDGNGTADGWMTRKEHLIFSSATTVGASLFLIILFFIIRFFPPSLLNVPNPEYWRSKEHYPRACNFLFQQGFFFLGFFNVFLSAIYYSVAQANTKNPPHLENLYTWGPATVLLIITVLWAVALILFFKRIPINNRKHN